MPIDYKKYPKDWKKIRARILERERHSCKECGAKNYDIGYRDNRGNWNQIECSHQGDAEAEWAKSVGYKIIKIVLTIAHLNHDISDNSDENLAALCQLHHLRHDISHHKENSRNTRNKKKGLQNLF